MGSSSSVLTASHKLEFGAFPEHLRRKEYRCSKGCPKVYKDAQAVEKHILREHPDPAYRSFVCMWCNKTKPSPQQILDHVAQAVTSGGHAVTNQRMKNDSVRASYGH